MRVILMLMAGVGVGSGCKLVRDCVPGQQLACACPGSTITGAQTCLPNGSGFGPCLGCPSVPDLDTGADAAADGASPGDSATANDGATTDDSAVSSDAATPGDGATNNDQNTSAGDAVTAGDGSSVSDAAAGDTAEAGMPDMNGGQDFATSDAAGVACGTATCDAGLICCLVPGASGLTATCLSDAACLTSGGFTGGMCGGPEDCPQSSPPAGGCCYASGDVPGPDGGTAGPYTAACVNPCDGYISITLAGQLSGLESQLCHTGADCAGVSGQIVISGLGSSTGGFASCCQISTGPSFRVCTPASVAQLLPTIVTCF